MGKAVALLVGMLFIIALSVPASASVYDFLDTMDSESVVFVYSGSDDEPVFDKMDEFMQSFDIANAYDDISYTYVVGDAIVMGTFYRNDALTGRFGTVWPMWYENAFIYLDTIGDSRTLFVTGENIDSTLDAIDYCIDYKSHASELAQDFITFTNGTVQAAEPSCTSDSDNGNPAVTGVIMPDNIGDVCISSMALREYSCVNGVFVMEEFECECLDGACLTTPGNIIRFIDLWLLNLMKTDMLLNFINQWLHNLL